MTQTMSRWKRYAGVLRARLAEREDSEHVQALIRIGFALVFAAYLYATVGPRADVHAYFAGFGLASCAIFAAIVARPQRSAWRRRFGTVVDLGTATAVMCTYGEIGSPLYGIYLWVTFGNGFRYGLRALYASQALSVAGFSLVIAVVPFWREHALLAGGLLVLLAAVPAYGAVLLSTIEQANSRLREQAMRDVLTGLYNRRYLIDALERELHRARRSDEQLGVLVIDIDHFKRINDSFGHAAGDEVLRSVAQFMLTMVRAGDVLCRYGGEEFVLLQTEAAPEALLQRADALRCDIARHAIEHHGTPIGTITLSIGIALFPEHGATAEAVLRAADDALYRAKAAGRNRIVMAASAAKATTLASPQELRT